VTPVEDRFQDGVKSLTLRDYRPAKGTVRGAMSGRRLQGENLHLWRGERHVLRGVGLDLVSGEVLQITGSNGAGKTSLLRTLCGFMYPEEGRVLWDGSDVRKDMPAYHSELAYVGHEPPLKADLTARENLRYWVGVRRPVTAAQLDESLDIVGARAFADRFIRTLSAGQKRRVALAGLRLLDARLWLLDEPTTNLDADGQKLVGRLIEEQVAQGGLVVAAVHHPLAVESARVRQLELAA
jgi:heme exporter protein A